VVKFTDTQAVVQLRHGNGKRWTQICGSCHPYTMTHVGDTLCRKQLCNDEQNCKQTCYFGDILS
jgi:hypothetical protein